MASSRVPACSLRSMCWGWLGAVPSLPLVPDTLTAVQAVCDCGHLPGRWEKWEVLAQGFLLCESGRACEQLAVLPTASLSEWQLAWLRLAEPNLHPRLPAWITLTGGMALGA